MQDLKKAIEVAEECIADNNYLWGEEDEEFRAIQSLINLAKQVEAVSGILQKEEIEIEVSNIIGQAIPDFDYKIVKDIVKVIHRICTLAFAKRCSVERIKEMVDLYIAQLAVGNEKNFDNLAQAISKELTGGEK